MKNISLILFIVGLCFISCEKENLLETSELGTNPYENPNPPYITIDRYDTPIRCSQIRMNIKVHQELLPPGMTYNKHRIEGPNGNSYIATRSSSLFVEVNCGVENDIYISLVNESLEKESPRLKFTITP